jgi:hypothetical protein
MCFSAAVVCFSAVVVEVAAKLIYRLASGSGSEAFLAIGLTDAHFEGNYVLEELNDVAVALYHPQI